MPRAISLAKSRQLHLNLLIDLGDRVTEEARLDLYQTTGASPPAGACQRDRNLAQDSRGYRVSKVRVHRREVA